MSTGRTVAGRYRITQEIGRGGMGVVWLAHDQVLDREVAVKEITFGPQVSPTERAILCERTLREARAAGRVDHPAVTRVHDVVEEDGKPWLVMEHVRSRTLLQLVQEHGPLRVDVVARLGLDLLDAVAAAHREGVVHRDVKPDNVLVDDAGRAHLTDFGIATTTGDSSLTATGTVLGSPSYMSPERATGQQPQPQDDLWSVGATLYTAVEGRPPFDRGDPMATLLAVVSDHPAPMVHAGPLQPVLVAMLARDPQQRPTPGQARVAFDGVLHSPTAAAPAPAPPPAPRPRPVDAGIQVQRFDAADLRRRAHDAKEILRALTDRPASTPTPPRPRFRFKRRWVVVPTLLLVLLAAAVVAGGIWLVAEGGQLLGG
ncbi:Serine/threonine protein kinase [Klenkia soli]|uniref:non-specific serine/threonine protein kinase n=1 Tax=Klenkia soli TaxID=1052260 RepID=A0A1H0L633_9ACTN|nr:serine/threonine-protein kinase [Klenkia soli]SDO63688.1 Serine/threonine protein kinase [Klenkia soli]